MHLNVLNCQNVFGLEIEIKALHIKCPGTKASLQNFGLTAKMAAMLVFVQIELELWLPWQHIRFNGKKLKIFFSQTITPQL